MKAVATSGTAIDFDDHASDLPLKFSNFFHQDASHDTKSPSAIAHEEKIRMFNCFVKAYFPLRGPEQLTNRKFFWAFYDNLMPKKYRLIPAQAGSEIRKYIAGGEPELPESVTPERDPSNPSPKRRRNRRYVRNGADVWKGFGGFTGRISEDSAAERAELAEKLKHDKLNFDGNALEVSYNYWFSVKKNDRPRISDHLQDKKIYTLRCEVPGLGMGDITVKILPNIHSVRICGALTGTTGHSYSEIVGGKFDRIVKLPISVNCRRVLKAVCEKGIFSMSFPWEKEVEVPLENMYALPTPPAAAPPIDDVVQLVNTAAALPAAALPAAAAAKAGVNPRVIEAAHDAKGL